MVKPNASTPGASQDSSLVSVIIPAFNSETSIAETLRSVMTQSYRELEIIVTDDGSTDGTVPIVESLMAEDPRIKLVHQSHRKAAAARNTAFRASNGAFIAPLDADDLFHPLKIEKQLAVFRRAGPELGLVYCWVQRIDHAGRIIPNHTHRQVLAGRCFKEIVAVNAIGCGSGALVRREAFERVGGFDEGCDGAEDHVFYCDIAAHYELAYVPELLLGYRKHEGGGTHNIPRMIRAYGYFSARNKARYPNAPQAALNRAFTNMLFWLITESTDRSDLREHGGRLVQALAADPAFMMQHWFLSGVKGLLIEEGRHVLGMHSRNFTSSSGALPFYLSRAGAPVSPPAE